MTYELPSGSRPDYRPVRRDRAAEPTNVSPVRRIMALRTAALLDQARATTEVAKEKHRIKESADAGYDLAVHVTARSAQLAAFIHDTGDDPELHQMHSFMKLAATEAVVNLIKGDRA